MIKRIVQRFIAEEEYNSFKKGLEFIFLTWGLYFAWLWPTVFYKTERGLLASYSGIYGDWPLHMAYANHFAYLPIKDWFENHPFCFIDKLNYYFVVDMISGILMRFKFNIVDAFIIPSILLTFFLLGALYSFYFFYLKSKEKAIIAVTLFLSSGGLGFWLLITGSININSSPELTHLSSKGIEAVNITTSELIPQRAFLLGIPIALLLIMLLDDWVKKEFDNLKLENFILYGVIAGSLLIVHGFSFIALMVTIFVYFIVSLKNSNLKHLDKWLKIIVTSLLVFILLQNKFIASNPYEHYPKLMFGWFPGEHAKSLGFTVFWFYNWGIFLVMLLIALFDYKIITNKITIAGIIIFVIANIMQFSPWDWNNYKIVTWAFLFFCIPVSDKLYSIWLKKNILHRILAITIFILMTVSGFYDLYRISGKKMNNILMWSNKQIEIAEDIKRITDPDALLLTSDQHDHLVPSLAGRRIFCGAKPYLWGANVSYSEYDRVARIIFSGNNQSSHYLKVYNINYVLVGPLEKSSFGANESFFNTSYPIVLDKYGYKLYKVL